jgi:hypothetical protein
MGIGDSIRRAFSRKRKVDLSDLEAFVARHKGVEGYIEPRTTTNPVTLLLVDRDGDHVRAVVGEPRAAVAFCKRASIPLYDAEVIGYPKRIKDFDKRSKEGAFEATTFESEIDELERRLSEPDEGVPNE